MNGCRTYLFGGIQQLDAWSRPPSLDSQRNLFRTLVNSRAIEFWILQAMTSKQLA